MNQIKDQHTSKRQKTTDEHHNHECKLCYVETCSSVLKCGHELCSYCCIKHFRKNTLCPFCRAVICEKEDRTNEYKQIIHDELHNTYKMLDYEPIKEVTMYEFLKFKGISRRDAKEIIDSIKDRCLEMFITSENYTETSESIHDEWTNEWDSCHSDDTEYLE